MTSIGLLTIHFRIAGCRSLKEKRSALKPLLTRLQREFNVSAAELDFHDRWQESIIGCCLLSNDSRHNQRSLQKIIAWIEKYYPHLEIVTDQIELI